VPHLAARATPALRGRDCPADRLPYAGETARPIAGTQRSPLTKTVRHSPTRTRSSAEEINSSVPDSPVFDDHRTNHLAVTDTVQVPAPAVRSLVDRDRNAYAHTGRTDLSNTTGGGNPAPSHTTAVPAGSGHDGSDFTGSSVVHRVDTNDAVAFTEMLPAATVIEIGSGSSIHNHVHTFTATRSRSGPKCNRGTGTVIRPTARSTNSPTDSAGGTTGTGSSATGRSGKTRCAAARRYRTGPAHSSGTHENFCTINSPGTKLLPNPPAPDDTEFETVRHAHVSETASSAACGTS